VVQCCMLMMSSNAIPMVSLGEYCNKNIISKFHW
jgi:hypothetical protein